MNKNHQGKEQEEGRNGRDGGNIEWKLSEVNAGLCLEDKQLIGEFKMTAGDAISIGW